MTCRDHASQSIAFQISLCIPFPSFHQAPSSPCVRDSMYVPAGHVSERDLAIDNLHDSLLTGHKGHDQRPHCFSSYPNTVLSRAKLVLVVARARRSGLLRARNNFIPDSQSPSHVQPCHLSMKAPNYGRSRRRVGLALSSRAAARCLLPGPHVRGGRLHQLTRESC